MYDKLKRMFDFCAAALGCIILAPFFLVLAPVIIHETGGSVFFTQKRVGKNKKHFKILKFRTMRADTPKDVPTHLLTNPEQYITKIGRFLRRTSLDELPQLINILKGEMSFVGPRPALWNQFDLIALREPLANACVPGLTGLAQIKGRDELPLKRKARYDNAYARKKCAALDLYILLKTIVIAAKGKGHKEGSGA